MPELLIIKAGNQYFRFKGQHYHPCELNQASVFPLESIGTVKKLKDQLLADGVTEPYIAKLTITEQAYQE